ncbi:hypothetical protein CC78DRAFT_575487 [Lojkania enalia]|uniref:Uncharacterized protein n=1 Tax=Lojkania enalia TaxID=147567 RepID=A0A9P4KHG9_9PLEO|nr:hypothetical protein CC78DRAFT_575487 [Didymosphaeria enalia]
MPPKAKLKDIVLPQGRPKRSRSRQQQQHPQIKTLSQSVLALLTPAAHIENSLRLREGVLEDLHREIAAQATAWSVDGQLTGEEIYAKLGEWFKLLKPFTKAMDMMEGKGLIVHSDEEVVSEAFDHEGEEIPRDVLWSVAHWVRVGGHRAAVREEEVKGCVGEAEVKDEGRYQRELGRSAQRDIDHFQEEIGKKEGQNQEAIVVSDSKDIQRIQEDTGVKDAPNLEVIAISDGKSDSSDDYSDLDGDPIEVDGSITVDDQGKSTVSRPSQSFDLFQRNITPDLKIVWKLQINLPLNVNLPPVAKQDPAIPQDLFKRWCWQRRTTDKPNKMRIYFDDEPGRPIWCRTFLTFNASLLKNALPRIIWTFGVSDEEFWASNQENAHPPTQILGPYPRPSPDSMMPQYAAMTPEAYAAKASAVSLLSLHGVKIQHFNLCLHHLELLAALQDDPKSPSSYNLSLVSAPDAMPGTMPPQSRKYLASLVDAYLEFGVRFKVSGFCNWLMSCMRWESKQLVGALALPFSIEVLEHVWERTKGGDVLRAFMCYAVHESFWPQVFPREDVSAFIGEEEWMEGRRRCGRIMELSASGELDEDKWEILGKRWFFV